MLLYVRVMEESTEPVDLMVKLELRYYLKKKVILDGFNGLFCELIKLSILYILQVYI